jgi:hypothetical protein
MITPTPLFRSLLLSSSWVILTLPLSSHAARSVTMTAHPQTPKGLPIVYHPAYSAPQLGPGHRFPMQVFKEIYETLLKDGLVRPEQVVTPRLPTKQMLLLAHDRSYLDDFLNGRLDAQRLRRIGFGEVTKEPVLIERTLAEVGGTLLTAELALEHGLACNTAGGTHHANHAHGSGFCILNDLAVTAKHLLETGRVERVLILDLDVSALLFLLCQYFCMITHLRIILHDRPFTGFLSCKRRYAKPD